MNNNAVYSTMIRAGRTTFSIDIREAKTGKKYLSISENRIDPDQTRQRATIRVFGDSINQFKQAVDEAAVAATQ